LREAPITAITPGAGTLIKAAKIDDVRDQFKRLLRGTQVTDLRDEALKKRWQRAGDAALKDEVIGATTFEGTDYLWEIEQPL
jgi:hypothetical protein